MEAFQTVANQVTEGMRTREEQRRNNSAALGQGPGSALSDTHNNIFELFIELKRQQMEDVSILHSREDQQETT